MESSHSIFFPSSNHLVMSRPLRANASALHIYHDCLAKFHLTLFRFYRTLPAKRCCNLRYFLLRKKKNANQYIINAFSCSQQTSPVPLKSLVMYRKIMLFSPFAAHSVRRNAWLSRTIECSEEITKKSLLCLHPCYIKTIIHRTHFYMISHHEA